MYRYTLILQRHELHWAPALPRGSFECGYWEYFLSHFIRFLFHLELPNSNKLLNWVFVACEIGFSGPLITKEKSSQCYIVLTLTWWWLVLLARAFKINPILATTRMLPTCKNMREIFCFDIYIWQPIIEKLKAKQKVPAFWNSGCSLC